jgi:hypothetical protein
MTEKWIDVDRPGYFGRKRDEKILALNEKYGQDNWRLAWRLSDERAEALEFKDACLLFYEESYYQYLAARPEDVDFICTFGECIDNATSNIDSGFDYTKQESYSTHIQDIAMRNVLRRLNKHFEGPKSKILVIRSKDSEGFRWGPGNVPFYQPLLIRQPSLCPRWANRGSVEDFWQSNKWIQQRVTDEIARSALIAR